MKNKNVYPWIVVALLWVVALLNYMDRQMLSTMQEAMKVDIVELNKAEAFGALMAVFLWIYGFMSPIAGMIADRVNRKWLVVGSLFVWSGVTYLMGYADNFHELYWPYDYKFPDLSEIAYNHLLKHTQNYKVKPEFYVINFDDPRRSHRCNPINPKFMADISDAYESAYTIMLNLNKTWV